MEEYIFKLIIIEARLDETNVATTTTFELIRYAKKVTVKSTAGVA
jgi:hypothetical protein